MWAYTGENILSALPSKIFPGVISHLVSKGGIQGFTKKKWLLNMRNINLKIAF